MLRVQSLVLQVIVQRRRRLRRVAPADALQHNKDVWAVHIKRARHHRRVPEAGPVLLQVGVVQPHARVVHVHLCRVVSRGGRREEWSGR
jgi:hypothetical protein